MTEIEEQVTERLIRYAKIDTQSDPRSQTVPTTAKQFNLARELARELQQIGASDIYLDEKTCVLYAKIPANTEGAKPLGLVTHMDTAPDAPGAGCKPWVLYKYDGKDIVLNKEQHIVMEVRTFASLKRYVGQDLVLTDGTTLLGGDDKAGISAVMTFAQYLLTHPEIKHGLISLAFTPDEEVGGLAKDLDLKRFASPTAYTLDGDHLGEYMDETFNAAAARIVIHGFSVHTGTAKGKLRNAVEYGAEFIATLPQDERPETTEGREGFYHVIDIAGNSEKTVINMILRDFDAEKFVQRQEYLKEHTAELNRKYGAGTAEITLTQQYRSMKEVVDQVPWLVENLKDAIRQSGLEPKSFPFRGGTDGSALSHRGLPCPNLSTGYENAHGRFEYVPVQTMAKNVEILLHLAEIFTH